MSEEAKPVCGHCMREIAKSETGVRHYGVHLAHAEHRCIYILNAEITALRAALDQERADNERLRAFAESVDWGARGRYGQVLKSREWIRRKMIRAGLMEDDGRPTALLSGRGEGEGNG